MSSHGGKREGAGRKPGPTAAPSATVRISQGAHRIFQMHAKHYGYKIIKSIDCAAIGLEYAMHSDLGDRCQCGYKESIVRWPL